MGRHANKKVLNGRLSLSVFQLRRLGYFIGAGAIGSFSWPSALGVSSSRVMVASRIACPVEHISLGYELLDHSGNKEQLNYSISLAATMCNYGGIRYWFICPLQRNDEPCGRRVAVLYLVGRYFGCRQCLGLTYRSQRVGRYIKESDAFYLTTVAIDYGATIKRTYYNQLVTRKQRRFQKIRMRLEKLGILPN